MCHVRNAVDLKAASFPRKSDGIGNSQNKDNAEGPEMTDYTDLISLLKSQWKRLAISAPILLIAGYFGLLIFNSVMQGRLIYVVKTSRTSKKIQS